MVKRAESGTLAGRVLGGRYEVGPAIGEGDMATIYRGTDRLLRRTVAVKVLAHRFARDEPFVSRFRREAKSAAALNHPNVMSVYDTGSHDGVHWIVMEHVEGMTLEEILSRSEPLTIRRALEITEGIGRGLAAAHERGLVHGDIKPANVMVDGDGRVRVMDFGIARASEDVNTLERTGSIVGTASYLSQQQSRGHSVDARSDIYSLGCVLYEMVTGRPPFTGDSPVAIAFDHVNEEPVPPSLVNPAVPSGLERVVMRALSKDPATRYQSARAMGEAVMAVARELGSRTVGNRTDTTEPLPRSSSRGNDMVPLPAPERRGGILVVARWQAVAVAALVVAGFLLGRAFLTPGGISTPDVRLLSRERAVELLEARGMDARVAIVRRADVGRGLVVRQTPGPGVRVEPGSAVRIVVSAGPRMSTVPDLVGERAEEAERLLAGEGLVIEPVDEVPNLEAGGTVIAQFPSPGTRVERGTAIGVVLSSGAPSEDDD